MPAVVIVRSKTKSCPFGCLAFVLGRDVFACFLNHGEEIAFDKPRLDSASFAAFGQFFLALIRMNFNFLLENKIIYFETLANL